MPTPFSLSVCVGPFCLSGGGAIAMAPPVHSGNSAKAKRPIGFSAPASAPQIPEVPESTATAESADHIERTFHEQLRLPWQVR